MKRLILSLATVAILGNAAPQRPSSPIIVDKVRANCPLTVTFGSYAMGIDSDAYNSILRALRNDRAVTMIEQRNWGREGEKTLCASIRKSAEARRLFARVKALFPREPRGPLTIETSRGLRYQSPAAMRR